MNVKRILKFILLIIFIFWIITSLFFYFQHNVKVERYKINKYIEFENYNILVKDIEIYNFQQNLRTYPDYIFKFELPYKLGSKLLALDYFYSRPYTFKENSYTYDINLEIIMDGTSHKYTDIINEFYILISEDEGELLKQTRKSRFTYSQNSNSISVGKSILSTGSKGKSIDYIKLVFDNSNDDYLIAINDDSIIESYNFFNKINKSSYKSSYDVSKIFLNYCYNDDFDNARKYINVDHIDGFNFNYLKKYNSSSIVKYKFSHLGRYLDKNHVFIMEVLDQNRLEGIKLYLVYEDHKWTILDLDYVKN